MFAKFTDKDKETTVYGYNTTGTEEVIEAFATNPYASGPSQNMLGTLHQYVKLERISQVEFNAAFLNVDIDEMDDEDKTACLGALMAKYADEAI